MKSRLYFLLSLFAIAFSSCDDTTEYIGTSLTDNMDNLRIVTDTFEVSTRSVVTDSVLSRNTTGYLGKIRDPETGNYITGDFMAQFHTLENYRFPDKDSILSRLDNGEIIADSCQIRLFYENFYGDSLAVMKLKTMEMATPMKEGVKYYSNFNPEKNGMIREGGIAKNKVYTLTDLSIDSVIRNNSTLYSPNIDIELNDPYTDKNGKTYNNYGTYIMHQYYNNPEYFKNSYNFTKNVCPGFYFKNDGGLGSMAYISISQLNVFFRYKDADTTFVGVSSFVGTEEVLQTTNITNDKEKMKELAEEKGWTYLKTPSGIYTEMTLPIDEILYGHENDTVNIAKIDLTRINNESNGKYSLATPVTLLMIPSDSIYTFFEKEQIADYRRSYLATYSSKYNNYTFNNISGIITYLANEKEKGMRNNPNWVNEHPNWNKVAIIPVTATYNASNQLAKVVHDMSLTSARLIGGSANMFEPIKLSIIYSKFNDK